MTKPNLNQISNLVHYMKDDEMIKVQFGNANFEPLYDVDLKTFNMIKWLRKHNKLMKLRNLLIDIGVKPKI